MFETDKTTAVDAPGRWPKMLEIAANGAPGRVPAAPKLKFSGRVDAADQAIPTTIRFCSFTANALTMSAAHSCRISQALYDEFVLEGLNHFNQEGGKA